MTTRRFLRTLGLSPRVETARAREAQMRRLEAITAPDPADERAFARAMQQAEEASWSLALGRTGADTPYQAPLVPLVELSSWVTGATGSGKTRFVGSILREAIALSQAGAPLAIIVVDGKGDLGDETLRGLSVPLAATAGSQISSRLRSHAYFDETWVPSAPLLARRSGIEPATLGHNVAHTLCDAFADSTVGSRQRALLAALLALAAERDIPVVALPWILSDLRQVEALARDVSSPSLRLELARLQREPASSVDGLSARLGTLLEVPSLRAALSGTTATDWIGMFNSGSLTVVQLGGAPLGSADAARVMGSLTLSAVIDAAFDPKRRIAGNTWVVIDEPTALLTTTSAIQLERLVSRGRSVRTSVMLVHQGPSQLSGELRTSLDTNVAWRAIGRSAERDADAAAEWFTRMRSRQGDESQAARTRWFVDLVGHLPVRQFLVSDRRNTFAPRQVEAAEFNPPAWSSIPAGHRRVLEQGIDGVRRTELEKRARELELAAERSLNAHRARPAPSDSPRMPRRRRGAVP